MAFYVKIVLSSVFDAEWRRYVDISSRTCWLEVLPNEIRKICDLMKHIKDIFQIADNIYLTWRGGVLRHDIGVGILKVEIDSPICVERTPPKRISPAASEELPSRRTSNNQTDDGPVARTNDAKSPQEDNQCGDHGFKEDNALADAQEHQKDLSISSEFLDNPIHSVDIPVRLNTDNNEGTEELENKDGGCQKLRKRKSSVIYEENEDAEESPLLKTPRKDYVIIEMGTPSPLRLKGMLSLDGSCELVSIPESPVRQLPIEAIPKPRVNMSPLIPLPLGAYPCIHVTQNPAVLASFQRLMGAGVDRNVKEPCEKTVGEGADIEFENQDGSK